MYEFDNGAGVFGRYSGRGDGECRRLEDPGPPLGQISQQDETSDQLRRKDHLRSFFFWKLLELAEHEFLMAKKQRLDKMPHKTKMVKERLLQLDELLTARPSFDGEHFFENVNRDLGASEETAFRALLQEFKVNADSNLRRYLNKFGLQIPF
mmetsp:Transcript_87453/g.267575  ORF Transcript_87453/g.267575 Transcript_87453/m.267575 type:complete len:152 (-) Transcript_87453:134-589(-)